MLDYNWYLKSPCYSMVYLYYQTSNYELAILHKNDSINDIFHQRRCTHCLFLVYGDISKVEAKLEEECESTAAQSLIPQMS